MRTLICIPCMDTLDVRFVESLTRLEGVGEVDIAFQPSSLIYHARNHLAMKAIEGKYDYTMWLDSDMVFEPDLMQRMFESLGKDYFLTALYFSRRSPYKPSIWSKVELQTCEETKEVKPIAEEYLGFPDNKRFEIAGCGFGCCLMKTDLLSIVYASQGMPFSPILGFGEDLSFCWKAGTACGIDLWCDSSIDVGHVAQTIICKESFQSLRR